MRCDALFCGVCGCVHAVSSGLLVATALMGLSFAIERMGLRYAPALFLVGLRFTMAGALFAWFTRKHRALANGSDRRCVLTMAPQGRGHHGDDLRELKDHPRGRVGDPDLCPPLFVVVGGPVALRYCVFRYSRAPAQARGGVTSHVQ